MHVVALLLLASVDSFAAQHARDDHCSAKEIGPGPKHYVPLADNPSDAAMLWRKCGFVKVSHAFTPSKIKNALSSWLEFLRKPKSPSYEIGMLRGERGQRLVPFSPPFDHFELLGRDFMLRPILAAMLGTDFVMDSAPLVVSTLDGGVEQEGHFDSRRGVPRSVSVQVPLHDIDSDFGPIGFCGGFFCRNPDRGPGFATNECEDVQNSCPSRVVGAPLAVGDAIIYAHHICHWGMANLRNETRYVLYMDFKERSLQEAALESQIVHDESIGKYVEGKFLELFHSMSASVGHGPDL